MAAKILLVEDDNNLREIYEARLQAEGYTIVTAKDGEEALVVAKAEKPDLVISDVMMPRISGFEMLDILRNTDELKETKVIMLTALGQADDKIRANSLGADRYLVKSQVTLEDIVKAAHELVEGTPAAPAAATTPIPAPAEPAPVAQPASAPAAPFVPPAAPATPLALSSIMGAQPAPAPVQTPAPTEPATPTAPTTAEEQATVGAQINSFVNDNVVKQDDAVLASAMTDLAANAEEGAADTPPAATTPEAPSLQPMPPAPAPTDPAATGPEPPQAGATDTANGSVPIANKKIIQPLNAEPKPSIHDLLAKEEAKGILNQGLTAPATMPTPAMPDASNTTPAPQASNAPAPDMSSQPPVPPHNPNDPNNISL